MFQSNNNRLIHFEKKSGCSHVYWQMQPALSDKARQYNYFF